MVNYLGVNSMRQLVKQVGLAAFLQQLVDSMEHDYRRWESFDKSARHAIHSPGGVIELMPTSDGQMYCFKYVNGHPKNTAEGLLTVTAFGVLADVDTGYPLLVSELTLTTALRTAAMSVLAARHMARKEGPGNRTMALIGNGAQSEFQALAFYHLMGVRELRLFDTDPAATAKLARNLKHLPLQGLTVVPCHSTAEAVRGSGIVTTVTADKRNATILTPDMIEPGMHLNAVGGDCPGKTELHPDILRRPDARVVVEFEPQSRIEGEIQQMPADFAATEFTQVLRGASPGRANDQEVTVFDSVGFALEDFSALRTLHALLHTHPHLATPIDLIPQMDNPKDLFGVLHAAPASTTLPRPTPALQEAPTP
ncbi:MAG: ornithine cyclodeaminase [Acidovorax sp.]|uniref:ornithine cyclodeaminase n=1 Tax=Acidovorax sp. TaxID=1872122 RepID=UPI003918A7D8